MRLPKLMVGATLSFGVLVGLAPASDSVDPKTEGTASHAVCVSAVVVDVGICAGAPL